MFVAGIREAGVGDLSVRLRSCEDLRAKPLAELIDLMSAGVSSRD
jgi:hypothetical protein